MTDRFHTLDRDAFDAVDAVVVGAGLGGLSVAALLDPDGKNEQVRGEAQADQRVVAVLPQWIAQQIGGQAPNPRPARDASLRPTYARRPLFRGGDPARRGDAQGEPCGASAPVEPGWTDVSTFIGNS